MSTGQTPLSEVERLYGLGRLRQAIAACDVAVASAHGADGVAALITKGALLFDAGDVVGAIDVLTQALYYPDADKVRRFDAALSLFSKVSQFQSPDDSLPGLSRIRQMASEVGSAGALGSLHLVVARLEALRGNCGGLRQHLEISRQLLATAGAPGRSAVCLVDAALEISAGNMERARAAAAEGLTVAQCAGRHSALAGCLTNQGSLLLTAGATRSAEATLREALALAGELPMVRFSALDALAQAALDDGRLDDCGAFIAECRTLLGQHRVPARSWYDLSHDVTRCMHHERRGEWSAILAIADAADPELAQRQYQAIRTSLLSAKARALARLGQHRLAEAALNLALRTCPSSSVDPLIVLEASRAACAALRGDGDIAERHFDRALAGCRAVGHRYHERWIAAMAEELRPSLAATASAAPLPVEAGLLLTDVATILGAGHSVDLMAHRTASLLQATSLGSRVQVTSERGCEFQPVPSASWEAIADATFAIHLRGSDRRVTITVRRVHSIDDMALIKSVTDVVQAAVARGVDGDVSDDLWPKAPPLSNDEDALFRLPRMVELFGIATRLATTDIPVLITGETGTGKEIFARLVHDRSRHRRGPFVPFNCSAVSKDLLESQLFGHRRGAFTGAHESFAGVIKAAERGTLFLDEIGDLDLAVQPKLLRFLESGEVHAVGDAQPRHVEVRLVAATNVDLDERMRQGAFRRDLFYRIGVTRIVLPPLRDRKDEIPALAAHFLARFARRCGRLGLWLADDLVAALVLYDWPGNIRELSNEMRRLVALAADGDGLRARDLAPDIARGWFTRPVAPAEAATGPGVFIRLDQTLAEAVSQLEEQFIDRALRTASGRVSDAAQILGLSRKGLFLKRRRRGLTAEASVPNARARG